MNLTKMITLEQVRISAEADPANQVSDFISQTEDKTLGKAEYEDLRLLLLLLNDHKKSDLAIALLPKINFDSLDKNEYFDILLAPLKYRSTLGEEDHSVLLLKGMIKAGLDITKTREGPGDLFSEVIRQIEGKSDSNKYLDTDKAIIKTLLLTEKVDGCTGLIGKKLADQIDNMTIQEIQNLVKTDNRKVPDRLANLTATIDSKSPKPSPQSPNSNSLIFENIFNKGSNENQSR